MITLIGYLTGALAGTALGALLLLSALRDDLNPIKHDEAAEQSA